MPMDSISTTERFLIELERGDNSGRSIENNIEFVPRVELPASMEASDHDKSFVDPEPNIPRNIKTEENFDDDQDKSFVDSEKYRTAIIHSRVELPASMEASDHDKSFVDPEPNIPRNIKTEENFDDDQDKSFVDSEPTIPSNVKTAEASDDQDQYFVASEPKIPFNIRTAEGSDDSYEEELAQQQWQTPLPVRRPASGSNRPSREVGRPEVATQSRNTQPKNTNNELLRHLFRNDVTDDPALARRLRDFTFAQQKRRETYGYRNPWGIIGLYDHLTGIRVDIEWAEDAAWRREHEEPYLSWADFESAKDSGLNQPFFTYIIMFICTGCLILSIGVNGWKIESLTVNPMIGPSAQTLIDVGAKKTSLIVNDNEWFRLFSPMFLHAGVIHYVLNMLALWFVGSAVEMNHGFINAAILFIIPAIGGTIMSALFLPEYISVGASGGIFGLIGGCIADIVSNWNLLFSKVVNPVNDGKRFRHFWVLIWLLLDILLNVVIGLTPFVDNFTHLGGMVYGFLCGLGKLERLSHLFFGVKKGFLSKFQSSLVRFFGFILSIVCIIITSFVLLRSDGEKITNCRGCRYVSCVPFPFWAEKQDKWWHCDDCDLVTADASHNTVTNIYSAMNLTCPDRSIIEVDLFGENIKDQLYLQKQLPKYCRDNCLNLFAE